MLGGVVRRFSVVRELVPGLKIYTAKVKYFGVRPSRRDEEVHDETLAKPQPCGQRAMTDRLSPAEIDAFLISDRPGSCGWTVRDGKLCVSLAFGTFQEAFSFMTAVALYAESRDHHPEWCNVYNRLEIALRTHAADGITQKDIDLAAYITRTYPRYAAGGATHR